MKYEAGSNQHEWSFQIMPICCRLTMSCFGLSAIFARYLGLGRRYEAGICTIVISMNGAFQRCPFYGRLNFDPKS